MKVRTRSGYVSIVSLAIAVIASAQAYSQHTMEEILELSKVRDIVGGSAEDFLAGYSEIFPGSGATEPIHRVAARYLTDSALYHAVLGDLEAAASADTIARLGSLYFSDEAREIREVIATYDPPLSQAEYQQGLKANPAAEVRLKLVDRFVAANEAGRFYTELKKARLNVVRDVALAVQEDIDGLLPELNASIEKQMIEAYSIQMRLYFLWTFEALSDEQLEWYVRMYETPEVRWYNRAYTDAITGAIREAGREMVAELKGREG